MSFHTPFRLDIERAQGHSSSLAPEAHNILHHPPPQVQQQPPPQHHLPPPPGPPPPPVPQREPTLPPKAPYGSGDHDDGYTLVFDTIEDFQKWRMQEELDKVVEFVKGDTHGSKAVPPRFKDHTKLVCARHTRSGRKKYIKKHPERVRKVPSRKIEGEGCPASISYKTYHGTTQVRACYNDQHSHEIGPANLPFTRRGRKAAAEKAKNASSSTAYRPQANPMLGTPSGPSTSQAQLPLSPPQSGASVTMESPATTMAGPPSTTHSPLHIPAQPLPHSHHNSIPAAVSLLAPLPPAQPAVPPDMSQDRWDRMSVLFQSVRDHARNFEYPGSSVAALESVLIRLYLESPIGGLGDAMGGGA